MELSADKFCVYVTVELADYAVHSSIWEEY